ncbi:unnamed protein product [Fraxinus pennsylvanica]|uniref:Gnk2-homologous domain-containing protein n=1 Tax=Fraxinus pennsylvanica TaxID=56036 RepID=A0AAD1Z2N0_9LAMI|nr:unnamed protein product [Fraxinus pennsylvanica]
MKKFIACQPVITFILVNLVLPVPDAAFGDPRAQIVYMVCGKQFTHNTSISITTFVDTMEKISPQMQTSGYGMAVTSSGPDTNYALADCYGDLSLHECALCYAEARAILPQCFPSNGGRIFLDGCFMRAENYSFFQEYTGPNDRVLCGNRTQKNSAFRVSVRQAVEKVVSAAPKNYFYARAQVPVSGTANESAYVLVDCWRTLGDEYCRACLENASASILGCLPWSEGKITIIIVATVSSIAVLVIGAVVGVYIWKRRTIQKKKKGDAEKLVKPLYDSCLNFKYSTLEKATGSFDEANKLGQGSVARWKRNCCKEAFL